MSCSHRTTEAIERDDHFGFMCDGCLEMGYGSCYNCTNGCDYQLHKECRTASPEASHLFEKRSFILQIQETPNTTKLCKACGMAVKGWRYHTDEGRTVFLHPWCMKQPHSMKLDDVGELSLSKKLESIACYYCKCKSLGEHVDGWAYITANQKIGFHVKCMKDKMYENWTMYTKLDKETDASTQSRRLTSTSTQAPQQFQSDHNNGQLQYHSFAQQPDHNVGQQQYGNGFQQPGHNGGQHHHHHHHHVIQHNYYHPPLHHHYYPHAGQQQNNNPEMTPGSPDKPTSHRKRAGLGKVAAATAGIFVNLAVGEMVGVFTSLGDA